MTTAGETTEMFYYVMLCIVGVRPSVDMAAWANDTPLQREAMAYGLSRALEKATELRTPFNETMQAKLDAWREKHYINRGGASPYAVDLLELAE